jgi:hypothetical protein
MLCTALPSFADSATYRRSGKTHWWRNVDYELLLKKSHSRLNRKCTRHCPWMTDLAWCILCSEIVPGKVLTTNCSCCRMFSTRYCRFRFSFLFSSSLNVDVRVDRCTINVFHFTLFFWLRVGFRNPVQVAGYIYVLFPKAKLSYDWNALGVWVRFSLAVVQFRSDHSVNDQIATH